MLITFRCPHCSSELSFDDLSLDSSPCPRCEKAIPLHITQRMRDKNQADQCAICGLEKLYIQKDFNRTLGITLFLTAAAISTILYSLDHVWSSFLVLVGAVVIDSLLFRSLPLVTICYRCHAQYREVAPNPENGDFELGLAEKYDPKDKSAGAENPAAEWKQH